MSVPNNANAYLSPSPVIPMFLIITAITNANPMVVTTTTANNYVVGQLVYLSVPRTYGMFQANQLTGQITAIDPTNLIFTLNINASNFDVFSIPAPGKEMPATMSPAGSRNIYNVTSVPFHSQGNSGN